MLKVIKFTVVIWLSILSVCVRAQNIDSDIRKQWFMEIHCDNVSDFDVSDLDTLRLFDNKERMQSAEQYINWFNLPGKQFLYTILDYRGSIGIYDPIVARGFKWIIRQKKGAIELHWKYKRRVLRYNLLPFWDINGNFTEMWLIKQKNTMP